MFNRWRLVSLRPGVDDDYSLKKKTNYNGPAQNPDSTKTGADQSLRESQVSSTVVLPASWGPAQVGDLAVAR
jgi:hypothetical protein